jgi:hypothetical protein
MVVILIYKLIILFIRSKLENIFPQYPQPACEEKGGGILLTVPSAFLTADYFCPIQQFKI